MRDFLGVPGYPDDHWQPATPAEVGLDARRLQAALDAIEARRLPLHGFLLVRHGRLVVERYGVAQEEGGRQLGPNDLRHLQSTVKTLTSMLVGLAIAEGRIPSVDAPVSTWFPELAAAGAGKARLTIAHLLTMRSGLTFAEGSEERLFEERCVAEAYLARPLQAPPGERWNYSTADSQVLAELVRRATGATPLEYARARILEPLGIRELDWRADRSGTHLGGRGLSLRPRDLARFGWLLASGGRWGGAARVPAAWIAEATRPWVVDHGHPSGPYGYHCWITTFGGFATRGYMGQNVYVLPEQGLVAVFTAGLPFPECDGILDGLMTEFVLPAVRDGA